MHCIASRFPTTLNYIAESNFYGSRSLVSLTSLAQQPPLAEPDIFGESAATESATLYVPDASLDAYKSADVWKDFFSIKGVCQQLDTQLSRSFHNCCHTCSIVVVTTVP